MADEQLGAVLDLDISSALAGIDDLGNALDSVLAITPEVDTSAIEPAISDAVSSADTAVPLEASGAETITSDIDDAVASADATVPLNADPGEAEAAIGEVADTAAATDATIAVDADTSNAEEAIGSLGDTAATTGQQLTGASSSAHEFGGATEAVAAASGLAVGSTSELSSVAGGLGGVLGPAAIAAGAVGAGIGELASKGIEATGAFQRFQAILGPTATAMETINVGSLNVGLAELGNKLGTTETQMRNTAASLFQFGINSGASRTAADTFGESIIALSARAVALNPSLGTVADAADSLGVRIARGGRFAAQFGIDLTAADINARALADTGKSTAADLSIYEKAAAGAALATEKYGGSLQGDVVTGSQNAVIQSRNLKVAFDEALVSIGKPLVAPLFDVIRAGIPVATAFGTVLGQLGTAVLPAVAGALELVGPPLAVLSDALGFLAPVIGPVVAGFLAFEAISTLPAIITAVATAFDVLGLSAIGAAADEVAASTAMLATPIGLIAAGVAAAAVAFGLFGSSASDTTDKMKGFAAELDKVTGKDLVAGFEAATDAFNNFGLSGVEHAKVGLEQFKVVADENVGTAQRLLTALNDAGVNTDGYAAILRKAVDAEKESAQAKGESAAASTALGASTQTLISQADAQATATTQVNTAIGNYVDGTGSAADVNNALKTSTQLLTDAIDLLFGRFLGADQASNNFKLAIINLGDQLFATGFKLDGVSEEGLKNRNALDAAGTAAGTAATAIANAGGTIAQQQQPFIDYRTSLEGIRTALANAGQDTSFVDGLIANTDRAIAAVGSKQPEAAVSGAALGQGFASGVGSAAGDAQAQGALLALKASEGAAGVSLGSVGLGVGLGFAAGIGGATPEAEAQGRALGNAAKRAMQQVLNSASPSKVIRDEVGLPFGQGFALGIRDSIPDVTKAATDLAVAATGATSEGVKGAAGTFTPAVTAGPGPQQLALSSASIDQLAAAIAQRSGQTGGRGTGIFIEHATFGSQGAAADMDFWAQVTTARV